MRKPYQEKITLDHIRNDTSLCFYQELKQSEVLEHIRMTAEETTT